MDGLKWGRLSAWRTVMLAVLGLAGFAIMAFLIYFPAGFGVLGAGAWFLEYLSQPESERRRA